MSEKIKIFEVGPRDGLQNEKRILSFKDKLWLTEQLIQAGIRDLELGAFVRPDRVPQMADSDEIFKAIQTRRLSLRGARAWCLVPNRKGLARALEVGADHLAIFTAATESFTRNNIGMSVKESLVEYQHLIADAPHSVKIRGYVSTVFGCPFEGKVAAKKALKVIEKLARLNVAQISIGDTIGVATPNSVKDILVSAIRNFGAEMLAVHFHDTRGTALANSLRAIDLGIRCIDSSIGGLGGCPFAPGAAGNLATEDLLYMLEGMKFKTGIDLQSLCETSLKLERKIGRPLASRYLASYKSSQ